MHLLVNLLIYFVYLIIYSFAYLYLNWFAQIEVCQLLLAHVDSSSPEYKMALNLMW
jgi:hypothetical protein